MSNSSARLLSHQGSWSFDLRKSKIQKSPMRWPAQVNSCSRVVLLPKKQERSHFVSFESVLSPNALMLHVTFRVRTAFHVSVASRVRPFSSPAFARRLL